jgi:hypothetical protein
MAIPFRDQEDIDELGTAAFFKFEADPTRSAFRGALFQVNAKGEPIEFTYNRVETPNTFLWRPDDVRRSALNRLTASLLRTAPKIPRLIFCLAQEIGSDTFCQDLQVSVPVCRIASPMEATPYSSLERREEFGEGEPVHFFWFPSPPADGSPERDLVNRLLMQGLVLEPFARAAAGLVEVYSESDGGKR